MSHSHNRIVLWRHGQTDWNVENRFQGHSDIALNAVGQFQVKHAAPLIAQMNPTKIIASDLGRAVNTAKALSILVNLEIEIDNRLRETNGGNWEGKTGEQNRAEDFTNFVRWIDGDDIPAGGIGERRIEVMDRAVAAINDALKDKTNQTLVVATHGGTARCVIGGMLKLPPTNFTAIGGLSNACWSILESSPRGWHLVEHNAGSIPEPILGEESGGENLR